MKYQKHIFVVLTAFVCFASSTMAAGVDFRMVTSRNDATIGGEYHVDVEIKINNGASPQTLNSVTVDIDYGAELSAWPSNPDVGWILSAADGYLNEVNKLAGRYRVLVTGNDVNNAGNVSPPGDPAGFDLTTNFQKVVTLKWTINSVGVPTLSFATNTLAAAYFDNISNAPQGNVTDWDVQIWDSPLLFYVERVSGNVYADGSFIGGGADLAERINVSEPVEPGDVVELDPAKSGHYRKARSSSQLLAGVITTAPGFTLGNNSEEMEGATRIASAESTTMALTSRPMLALMGRVPVKVTTENGVIRPGDLLTISSKPGIAMRYTALQKCENVIIGKALEGLTDDDEIIMVLVMAY